MRLKSKSQYIILVLSLAGLFFLLGFFQKYHLPRIKNWLLVEIEKVSREKSPIRMWAQEVELHLFPIGVSFKDVRLQPNEEIKKTFAVNHLDELGIYLSFWGFLRGRLQVGRAHLLGAEVKTILRDNDSAKKTAGIDLNILRDLPIRTIELENINVLAKIESTGVVLRTPDLDVEVELRGTELQGGIQAKALRVKRSEDPAIFEADIDLRFKLDKKEVTLTRLKVQKDDSFVLASGWAEWNPKNLSFQKITGRARSSLYMPDVRLLLSELLPDKTIPKLGGRISFEGQTEHKIGTKLDGEFELTSNDLSIDHFYIGNLDTNGRWVNGKLDFDKLLIEHMGGTIRIEEFEVDPKTPLKISGRLFTEKLDVNRLLKGLGVDRVPVYSNINSNLSCSAIISPFKSVNCEGKLNVKDLAVNTSLGIKKHIVEIKQGLISGKVSVDAKSVKYNAAINLPETSGFSDGEIIYTKGFDIKFRSEKLDLKDFGGAITGLPLAGQIAIEGGTKGDGDHASFNANIKADNFYVDNFGLASFTTKANYLSGNLSFQDIQGQHRSTQYHGQLLLNFKKDTIFIDAKLPFLDLLNIQELTEKKFKWPFELTGTGSAHIKLKGPIGSDKLDFDLQAKVFRGLIAQESFDQIQVDITSENGLIKTRDVSLSKGPGRITLKGQGQFGGNLDGQIIASNFRLEQSETIANFGVKVAGRLDLATKISGNSNSPDLQGRGEMNELILGEQSVDSSAFDFNLTKDVFSGHTELGSKVAELFWTLGLKDKSPVNLVASFKNWDFSKAFSMFSNSLRAESYSANINGEFKVSGRKGEMALANVDINLNDLMLKADDYSLRNKGPMTLKLQGGQADAQNFEIKGQDSFIRLRSLDKKSKDLSLSLDGRIDLKLLGLLAPFMDDLSGKLNLGLAINGSLSSPLLSGNAFLDSAFIRIRNFPHPLEQTTSDILFDKKKLIINSLKSRFAGGSLSATGQILFNDIQDLPIDIRGQFTDASFQFPPGFNTRGSGSIGLKGNWFPYVLSVDYNVISGNVDREIKSSDNSQREIKPSLYLPKFLAEKRFSPIDLNLDVELPSDMPVKLRITRLDIDSRVSGKLKIQGPPETPLLAGRIRISKGSKIVFRDNTFEVQSGNVEYKNTPPENPNLNISAESRVRATVGTNEQKDFDVALRVLGPAAEPRVSVSSQPALSESELLSLLTLGFITQPESNTTDATSSDITNTSYQLGSAFLNEQLGLNREIGKRLGLEFDLSSAYSSQEQTAVHTISVKKQWTPKFGTSASRSVGKTNTNSVRAEYKITNNVSVIGNYEGREQTGASSTTDSEEQQNLFGLDFEYRLDFK